MLDDEAGALTRQAIDLAKAGDVTALRLCIDRLVPKRTERPIEFKGPRVSEPKNAVAALSRIMDGVARGADRERGPLGSKHRRVRPLRPSRSSTLISD